MRALSPSDGLKKWFDHKGERWDEFKKRYFGELRELAEKEQAVEELRKQDRQRTVTLHYTAKKKRYNNAVALKEFIRRTGFR
jgi:uncharacterized protein YeaO (DUF488 family)